MIFAMRKIFAVFCVGLMSVVLGGVALATTTSQPLSVSSDEMTKLLTYVEQPVYPPSAKAAGTTGKVVLNVVVDCTGKVESDTVTSGSDEFATSAASAVKNWTYKPYTVNGTAVRVQTVVTVNFSLGK